MNGPWVDIDAPVCSIDVAPYVLTGCDDCEPWSAEIFTDDEGGVFVREWHAVDCPLVARFHARQDECSMTDEGGAE